MTWPSPSMILCFLVFMVLFLVGIPFRNERGVILRPFGYAQDKLRRRISYRYATRSFACAQDDLSLREGQLIETLRVAKKDRLFVFVRELVVFFQLFQLVLAGLGVDFVRIIARIDERLIADDAHGLRDRQFFSL